MKSIPEDVVMHEVDSSNIKRMGHDGRLTTYVEFHHGGTYAFMNMAGDVYDAWETAPSIGRFFHNVVKGNYPYERLDKEDIVPEPQWKEGERLSCIIHKVGAEIKRATERSAGFDLVAAHSLQLPAGQRALVGTNLKMAMPDNLCSMVIPRSGLALKKGITVTNAPGLIDPDYRGEIGVILQNTGDETFIVQEGDRIAQLVFVPFAIPDFIGVDKLGESDRGESGFGSTGVK